MITMIISTLLIALVFPMIYFCTGFLGGYVIQVIFGQQIVDALNLVFNTTRFDVGIIAWVAGTISTIGWLFSSSSIYKRDTNVEEERINESY